MSAGLIVGQNVMISHKIMLIPKAMGRITWLAGPGKYTLNDDVIEIEFQGQKKRYTMLQYWPVRSPRPVVEKLAGDAPLLTGQRVLVSLLLRPGLGSFLLGRMRSFRLCWGAHARYLGPSAAAKL